MRRLIKQASNISMILDGRKAQTFVIVMQKSVASLRVVNAVAGVLYVFVFKQTSIGGKTLTWASNTSNAGTIDVRPLAVTVQSFVADTGGILKGNEPSTWSEL